MTFVRKFKEPEIPRISAAAHPLWRTVRLEAVSSVSAYGEMLKEGKRKPSSEALETLDQLPLRELSIELPLFCVSVRALGFSLKGAHYDELSARAAELGYGLCPADTPLQLAREYADQSSRQQIRVAAPPVFRKNAPYIHVLVHEPPGQRWLQLDTALPSAHFGPQTLFLFTLAQAA